MVLQDNYRKSLYAGIVLDTIVVQKLLFANVRGRERMQLNINAMTFKYFESIFFLTNLCLFVKNFYFALY